MYAGRLVAEKGLKHLIQALAAGDKQWRLVIAGEGPDARRVPDVSGSTGRRRPS